MSFSNEEARIERETTALQLQDSEALYKLAEQYKKEGYDEYAETLKYAAKKIEAEEAQEDQVRADKEERDTERADEHYSPSEGK
jgi:hypothetical protein